MRRISLFCAQAKALTSGQSCVGRMMLEWGFWAAAGGITVIAFAVLVQALRRTPPAQTEASLTVYRDQLAEVDRDLARGLITAAEADRVRLEVQRRLLDADRARQAPPTAASQAYGPVVALMGAVLLSAIAGYVWLGAPGYPDLPLVKRLALADETHRTRPDQAEAESVAPPETTADFDPEFLDLMAKLRAAVLARPDDRQGLALLARNETMLGNFKAARVAQQHLVDLLADTATAADHLGLAQAMIASSGGYVSPQAEAQLVRTLELDPANSLARYFSGLMFAQNGRPDRTFGLWQPLLAEGPADAPWMASVQASLADVADRAGIKYRPEAANGPDAAAVAAAADMTPAARQEMIKGMVAQLETRLTEAGGPLEDWLKLINAVAVLGEPDRARAAVKAATAAFATDPAALAAIKDAATAAGITP